MLLGFAFLPAGLKKVLGQPFTDPANTGPFHEFLHAFHGTGFFYHFVGMVQLLAAVLLITQRFATPGIILLVPILGAILVFCWSTMVVPTASVVTLMSLGALLLIFWDIHRWVNIFSHGIPKPTRQLPGPHPTINMKLWSACGSVILLLYLGNTAITGEVYRPRGVEWSNPSFIVLVIIALLPLITYVIDTKGWRRKSR